MNLKELERIGKEYFPKAAHGIVGGELALTFEDIVEAHWQPLINVAKAAAKCRRDIWQTARANQMSLTGVDIACRYDSPCPEAVGKPSVHQRGVDESLALVREIDAALKRLEDVT